MNKKKIPKPISQFKLWDYKKTSFYLVSVLETKQNMYDYHNYWYKNRTGDNFLAICKGLNVTHYDRKLKKWKKSDFIGEVIFYLDSIRSGIVSHELSHATLYWYLKKKYPLRKLSNTKYDEKFAWELGHFVSEFWSKFYRYLDKRIKKMKN